MTPFTAPLPAAERTQAAKDLVKVEEAALRRAVRWCDNGYQNSRQRVEAGVYYAHCYQALLAAEDALSEAAT